MKKIKTQNIYALFLVFLFIGIMLACSGSSVVIVKKQFQKKPYTVNFLYIQSS